MGPIDDPRVDINAVVQEFLDAVESVRSLQSYTPPTESVHGNPVNNFKASRAAVQAPSWVRPTSPGTGTAVIPNADLTELLKREILRRESATANLALNYRPGTTVRLPSVVPNVPTPRVPTTAAIGGPLGALLSLFTFSGETNMAEGQQAMDAKRIQDAIDWHKHVDQYVPPATGAGALYNILRNARN